MNIAVDVDDVLAALHSKLNDYYNLKYNKNHVYDEYDNYFLGKIWNVRGEKVIKIIEDFYESDLFHEILPIEGSQSGIKNLKNHNLFVVTSRPKSIEKETIDWINKYFPKTFKEIIFTGQATRKTGPKITKAQLCLDNNIDIIIEDSPWYVKECAEVGVPSIILNRPWNQKYESPVIAKRADEWKGVVQIVNNL
ncbi:hypothetical protein ACFL1M_01325 [Patescibacteria group bacterium]